jgi:hypothetical protein
MSCLRTVVNMAMPKPLSHGMIAPAIIATTMSAWFKSQSFAAAAGGAFAGTGT